MSNREPPTPPTGDYMDPDSGWSAHEEAKAEWDHEQAQIRFHEQVVAAAFKVLLQQGETTIALALLDSEFGGLVPTLRGDVVATLLASPETLSTLLSANARQGDGEFESKLFYAFRDVLPPGTFLASVDVRARLDEVSPDWRREARASLVGGASNQGRKFGAKPILTHNGLNYRTQSEIVLARELEARGVLFFPNSASVRKGVSREPDFLIVEKGKAGIIEVDGEAHTGKAADDHMRDLFFEQAGIRVKHFHARDVAENPKIVVDQFLEILLGP